MEEGAVSIYMIIWNMGQFANRYILFDEMIHDSCKNKIHDSYRYLYIYKPNQLQQHLPKVVQDYIIDIL